jgi:hypothetical protein
MISKLIFIYLILMCVPLWAQTVDYKFPPAGTVVKFSCKGEDAENKPLPGMKGTHTFLPLKFVDGMTLHPVEVEIEKGAKFQQFREDWQIPTEVHSRRQKKEGDKIVEYSEKVLEDSLKGKSSMKVGQVRTLRTVREDLKKNDSPKDKIGAKDIVTNHSVRIVSKGKFDIVTAKGPKSVEVYNSRSATYGTSAAASGPIDATPLVVEVVYSPEMKLILTNKRTNPDGSWLECSPIEWDFPGDSPYDGKPK